MTEPATPSGAPTPQTGTVQLLTRWSVAVPAKLLRVPTYWVLAGNAERERIHAQRPEREQRQDERTVIDKLRPQRAVALVERPRSIFQS